MGVLSLCQGTQAGWRIVMLRIITVVGARPQFIKAATVSRALKRRAKEFTELIVHTGQHYDDQMSSVFFRELDIARPQIELGIGGLPQGAMTGRMLEALEREIRDSRPDAVLVYGDTNSTLAGALAAVKLHVPVAHVEAGLRSFNRRMPEEINRVLTDHVASLLFAPTRVAVANLHQEGIAQETVHLVGDVMYDAALHFAKRAEEASDVLERLRLERGGYVLATVHRAENTDDRARLAAIADGLARVGVDIPVVFPVHPRTRAAAQRFGINLEARGVRVVEPVGYLDMVMLEKHARLVVTDSGGVQKEAFFCRVPCVTLRQETEWTELVELGANRLVPPTDGEAVAAGIAGSVGAGTAGPADAKPYGDGHAAERVVDILARLSKGA